MPFSINACQIIKEHALNDRESPVETGLQTDA
jgi:hypothetical protein